MASIPPGKRRRYITLSNGRWALIDSQAREAKMWIGAWIEFELDRLDRISQLVEDCPFGWHEGKVITRRSDSEQDIINWLAQLKEIATNFR